MNKFLHLLAITFLGLSLSSCTDTHFKEDKIFAGGVVVTKKELNLGKSIYEDYCMACHGMNGDGKGVSSKGMTTPPRNFTQGLFKFGLVASGELPHDEDLIRIIKRGLHGTAMLPWDVTERQAWLVLQYIKTFAPKVWEDKNKALGKHIELSKDPFGLAHKSSAIEKGKMVYHLVANCQSCHRGYASKEELDQMSMKKDNAKFDGPDEEFYKLKPQDTEYGVKNIPPDFTWHNVRSATTVEELAYRIASGVGGTTMPTWKETISDEDIWAVAHYVRSLMDLKDSPERSKNIK